MDSIIWISICSGALAATLVVIAGILLYGHQSSGKSHARLLGNADNSDWLFHNINDKLYAIIFEEKKPEQILTNFGVDTIAYINDCNLTRTDPKCVAVVMTYIYSAIFMGFCSLYSTMTSNIPLFIVGIAVFFFAPKYRVSKIKREAQTMRDQVSSELSTFMAMLLSQLEVGINIEVAIQTLCDLYDCLLSREFKEAMMKSQMGALTWDAAMTDVSSLYGIEALNDFVMSTSIAMKKGTSIADVIRQKTNEIRSTNVSKTKEEAGKLSEMMNIPLFVFSIIPSILFILVPTLFTLNSGIF